MRASKSAGLQERSRTIEGNLTCDACWQDSDAGRLLKASGGSSMAGPPGVAFGLAPPARGVGKVPLSGLRYVLHGHAAARTVVEHPHPPQEVATEDHPEVAAHLLDPVARTRVVE